MIENRNAVRIVELPSCKMVSSGPLDSFEMFIRFHDWFSEYDKLHGDRFYPHNFMWTDTDGKMVWNYAVPEIHTETDGFAIIDFAGGLYAASISVDADGEDHDKVLDGIKEWVSASGCFELDETSSRRSLGTITSPENIKDVMGYDQMDLLFPIKIKY
jgi:hypothetical protein